MAAGKAVLMVELLGYQMVAVMAAALAAQSAVCWVVKMAGYSAEKTAVKTVGCWVASRVAWSVVNWVE